MRTASTRLISFVRLMTIFFVCDTVLLVDFFGMSKVLAIFNDCLKQVQSWVKELKKMLGSDISLVIAGNKVKAEKKIIKNHSAK